MKQFLSIFLGVLCCLSLFIATGCTGTNNPSDTTENSQVETPSHTDESTDLTTEMTTEDEVTTEEVTTEEVTTEEETTAPEPPKEPLKLVTTTSDLISFYDTIDEVLREIHAAGFRYIDYSMYSFQPDSVFMQDGWEEEVLRIKALAEELGLTFVQAHAQGGNPLNDSGFLLAATLRQIEICELLGIENIVVHAGWNQGLNKQQWFEQNKAFYDKLLPLAAEKGVNVLCENSTSKNMGSLYYINTGADMREFIEYVNHPNFHGCWDTGHANCEPGSQYDDIIALGDEMYAIHYNDNSKNGDEHLLIYCGKLDNEAVLQALCDVGYDGYFTFECDDPDRAVSRWTGPNLPIVDELGSRLGKYTPTQLETVLYQTGEYLVKWLSEMTPNDIGSIAPPVEEDTSEADEPTTPDEPERSLVTDKKVYTVGETITLAINGRTTDEIAFYPVGHTPGVDASIKWGAFEDSSESAANRMPSNCTVNLFDIPAADHSYAIYVDANGNLIPGEYKVVLRDYAPNAPQRGAVVYEIHFTVVTDEPTTPDEPKRSLATDKEVYIVGETIMLTINGLTTDEIAFYPVGHIPGEDASIKWGAFEDSSEPAANKMSSNCTVNLFDIPAADNQYNIYVDANGNLIPGEYKVVLRDYAPNAPRRGAVVYEIHFTVVEE